jgi:hypothetical protein
MSAAHKGVPLVQRDLAPGLPKHGPPWGIEGEPGGTNSFKSKRPFEANIEGNNAGHFGHHKNEPCYTKTPSVPLISNHHTHWTRIFHRNMALKLPVIFALRPIERVRNRRRTMQCMATSTWQHVMPPSHTYHSLHRTTHAGQTALSPLKKAKFSLIAWKKHFASVPQLYAK